MRVQELIQQEIVNQKPFTHQHHDERGLLWTAHSNGRFDLTIDVQDTHGQQIAYITCEVNPDEKTMSSQDTYVDKRYRRQGIATRMYDWAKELGNDIVKSSTLSTMGKKFWKHRTQVIKELDFMGHACTKDCSGHKAGYKWSLDRNGASANSPSASFNDGTMIAQTVRNQRAQGGGKLPQYTSQTKDAIRKREARLQAKQQQQSSKGNVENGSTAD